jgi:purine catabolism regulator
MHNDLRTLADYDKRTGSDLVATLKAYLDNERNVSKTADALFMHRNSIKYRLEKIESLLTSDLNDPDNRLLLHLAINVWAEGGKS